MVDLSKRSLLTLLDFSAEEIGYLLELAVRLKNDKYTGRERKTLQGKNIVLLFEKDSTRTRCSFEVAAYDQGARVTYLGPTGSQVARRSPSKIRPGCWDACTTGSNTEGSPSVSCIRWRNTRACPYGTA